MKKCLGVYDNPDVRHQRPWICLQSASTHAGGTSTRKAGHGKELGRSSQSAALGRPGGAQARQRRGHGPRIAPCALLGRPGREHPLWTRCLVAAFCALRLRAVLLPTGWDNALDSPVAFPRFLTTVLVFALDGTIDYDRTIERRTGVKNVYDAGKTPWERCCDLKF